MTVVTCTTVVGVFPDRRKADMAIDDLYDAGFRSDEIGVVVKDEYGQTYLKNVSETEGEHVGEGALAGAVAGAGIGGLVGLGVLSGVIPVVGPALAAGTLGVIASNAAGGAALAGLTGALVGWGVPEDHAKFYESELTAGRVIVTVTSCDRFNEARTILRSHGAVSRDPEM